MRQKRDPSELTCTVCGQVCNCQSVLRDHMNTHTGDRPYSCKHCHFTFGSIRSCRNHERVHEKAKRDKPKSYQCETCGKTYKVKSYFRKHVKRHLADGAPKKRYTCQFCGKNFHQLKVYKIHQKPASKMRNVQFQCKYCGVKIAREQCLKNHKRKYHETFQLGEDHQHDQMDFNHNYVIDMPIFSSAPEKNYASLVNVEMDSTQNPTEDSLLNEQDLQLFSKSGIAMEYHAPSSDHFYIMAHQADCHVCKNSDDCGVQEVFFDVPRG